MGIKLDKTSILNLIFDLVMDILFLLTIIYVILLCAHSYKIFVVNYCKHIL